ncbi:MAG: MBL fold metallo-hydrolase [Oscillospiraceae bacterium]|nr:MBL fold metallo-hydrolase [Oscillospiraceae bacterium]
MKETERKLSAKTLKAYPFNKDGEKRLYAKFNVDIENIWNLLKKVTDERFDIHISLINDAMIEADRTFFDDYGYNNNYRKYNTEEYGEYTPYFYEFIVEITHENIGKIKAFMDRCGANIGKNLWFECRFSPTKEDSDRYLRLDGDVIFSASPFQRREMTLVFTDTAQHLDVGHILDTERAIAENKKINSVLKYIGFQCDYSVKIYNVGQGNCVYIEGKNSSTKNSKFLFDVGYSTKPSEWDDKYRVEYMRDRYFSHFEPDVIILSHWDLDHVMGVCLLDDDVFNKSWIAPNLNVFTTKTVGASRLAAYLHKKEKLLLVDADYVGKRIFKDKSFELWHGNGAANSQNNRGLIITLTTDEKTILLSGDCEYSFLPSSINIDNVAYNYVVVPHHGAKMKVPNCCPSYYSSSGNTDKFAVVSYGKNDYGHPSDKHMGDLDSNGYKIVETRNYDYVKIRNFCDCGCNSCYDKLCCNDWYHHRCCRVCCI